MVERAEREPTVEEIVVALRETGRSADRAPPFTVVSGQPGGNRTPGAAADPGTGAVGATDITDLRDGEIDRLLTENARLNARIMFLLKVIEREQGRSAERTAGPVVTGPDQGALVHDVSAAVQAELRPLLLVLVRLLERQHVEPRGPFVGARAAAAREAPDAPIPQAAPYDAGGIVDFDAPG